MNTGWTTRAWRACRRSVTHKTNKQKAVLHYSSLLLVPSLECLMLTFRAILLTRHR
jgi:hypothetical protein